MVVRRRHPLRMKAPGEEVPSRSSVSFPSSPIRKTRAKPCRDFSEIGNHSHQDLFLFLSSRLSLSLPQTTSLYILTVQTARALPREPASFPSHQRGVVAVRRLSLVSLIRCL
ncbi:hypothetical protein YC2023_059881 [Brassica napus]